MTFSKNESAQGSRTVLLNRRFLTCRECGWVHYVMTAEEKESRLYAISWQQSD